MRRRFVTNRRLLTTLIHQLFAVDTLLELRRKLCGDCLEKVSCRC